MSPYVVTGERARQMRVVPAEVLKRLYARSDAAGFRQTAAHLALLIAGGGLVLATRGTWWVVPALLAQAVFVNTLFGAMHESVHYGSFKTRWMADLLAFFSGAAILNNAGFYRHYHLAHHRYTQDPRRDPELITSGTPRSWGNYLLRISSLPFLAIRARDTHFEIEPGIRFAGQVGEQATMFLYDPSGNALEFKAFKDPSRLFAK